MVEQYNAIKTDYSNILGIEYGNYLVELTTKLF